MRKIITFTVATLLTASAFGAGEIYRWKGPDGTWHYSDQPRPGAEVLRGPQLVRPSAAQQPATPADSAPPAPPESDEPLPVTQDVADEVRAQAATIRADQCKAAEAAYQDSLKARRIYRTDAQGNRVYMNEAEMDAARLQARANRDLACNGG